MVDWGSVSSQVTATLIATGIISAISIYVAKHRHRQRQPGPATEGSTTSTPGAHDISQSSKEKKASLREEIESIIRSYTSRKVTNYSDDWTWEEMLVSIASRCFSVPTAPIGEHIIVKVGAATYRVPALQSSNWNNKIKELGQLVRARERNYRRSKYQDAERVRALAEFIERWLAMKAGSAERTQTETAQALQDVLNRMNEQKAYKQTYVLQDVQKEFTFTVDPKNLSWPCKLESPFAPYVMFNPKWPESANAKLARFFNALGINPPPQM